MRPQVVNLALSTQVMADVVRDIVDKRCIGFRHLFGLSNAEAGYLTTRLGNNVISRKFLRPT